MDAKPLITVIIPVYNAEKYIQRCLKSISTQSYNNLEILVINDGSTDNSLAICKKCAKNDERIRVIDKKNEGVSRTRNYGIDISTGEYITFVDADDVIHPNAIANMLWVIEDSGMTCCFASFKKFTEKDIVPENWSLQRLTYQKVVLDESYDYSAHPETGTVWGSLYLKKAIGSLRFIEGIYVSEDVLFNAVLLHSVKCFAYIPLKLYGYIIYKNSAIHGEFDNKKLTAITAWQKVNNLYLDFPYQVYLSTVACLLHCSYRCIREEMMNKTIDIDRYLYMCSVIKENINKSLIKYIDALLLTKMYLVSYAPDVFLCLYNIKKWITKTKNKRYIL